jgi:hypothetical protein
MPLAEPCVQAAEQMLYSIAFLEHRRCGAESEDHWWQSNLDGPRLFRTIFEKNMPCHPRTQATARIGDPEVRGMCLGISFCRHT